MLTKESLAPGRGSWREAGHWFLVLLQVDSMLMSLWSAAELGFMWLAEQGDGLEGDGPGCHTDRILHQGAG